MRNVLENWDGGITINGTKINNLRYPDTTSLIAASNEDLIRVKEKSIEVGLHINKKN